MPDLAVILPAAGTSSRFGRDKLSELLDGKSVLERSIRAFTTRADVKQVIVVGRDGASDDRILFVSGGSCRAESVRNGLLAVSESIEWIAIHDAARPLISQELIDRTFISAQTHGAAAPALPVHLTIKESATTLPAKVERTVPRQNLYALQTPQIMRRQDLIEAFENCPIPLEQVTDDLQLLELINKPTWLVTGEDRNLKITTQMDLHLAKLFLKS